MHARKRTVLLVAIALACAVGTWTPAAAAAEGVVNINTAGEAQLQLLPRVGPSLAKRIIEYREANGPFKAPEELVLVPGIGEKSFELMEPYVAVEGETTLKEKAKGMAESAPPSQSKPAAAAKEGA